MTDSAFGSFVCLREDVMRLSLRVLHQRLNLPEIFEMEALDADELQELWAKEWGEHGKEYDRVTLALQQDDAKARTDARLNWAVPAIQKEIEENLGSLYLQYDVKRIQKRNEIAESSSLVITGGIGTGKTMALSWRCQSLALEKALTADYEDIHDLLAVYPAGELFNRLHKGEPVAGNACILAIDDYGVEYVEPFALSQFELLIEKRYARKLITLITTNIPKEAFKTRKGFERIESRLLKRCTFVEFVGEDRRKPLKQGGEGAA